MYVLHPHGLRVMENKPFISEPYRQLCTDMHQLAPWGTKGHKYIDEFLPHCRKLQCVSLLDYGCGQNTVKNHLATLAPDIVVTSYDPAIPQHAEAPVPAQFVICTDVMEHVEVRYVPNVLEHICSLTLAGAYFNIALVKAKRNLPDGTNAHITLYPWNWWMSHLKSLPWRVTDHAVGKKSLRVHLRK